MVLKGSVTRSISHAGRLANHLLNEEDNERVSVLEIEGYETDDPKQALRFMHGAVVLTGGSVGAYQVSINPQQGETMTRDQWADAIARIEKKFGFTGQPRLVVEHVKQGRKHIHVVWQRTDIETEKLISVHKDAPRLKALAREMAREYGHRPLDEKAFGPKFDQAAHRQSIRIHDRSPKERSAFIRETWDGSGSADQFVERLRDGGYELAQGNRARLVLLHGETGEIIKGSLPRHLKGPGRTAPKAAELREWAEGLSRSLPQVETLKEQIKDRQYIDRDQYESDRLKEIVDAAIEEEKQRGDQDERGDTSSGGRAPEKDKSFAAELDPIREREAAEQHQRDRLDADLAEFYGRDEDAAKLARLKAELAKNQGIRGRVTGRQAELEKEIEAQQKTLKNIDQRIAEQRGTLEARLQKERAARQKPAVTFPAPANENEPDNEAAALARYKAQLQARRRQQQRDRGPSR